MPLLFITKRAAGNVQLEVLCGIIKISEKGSSIWVGLQLFSRYLQTRSESLRTNREYIPQSKSVEDR